MHFINCQKDFIWALVKEHNLQKDKNLLQESNLLRVRTLPEFSKSLKHPLSDQLKFSKS